MKTFSYLIPPEQDGRMIKRIIRGAMGLSHRQFSVAKAAGEMRLDGESVHANRIVRAGQRVTICVDEEPERDVNALQFIDLAYEDEDLMVVNKVAPLPCQNSHRQSGDTLERRMAAYLPGLPFRPVNRLDKGTSGLMICAKHAHAQMVLSRQLHTSDFEREYLALVVGVPEPPQGVIDAPIGKADGATIRREVRPDGKPARTMYETLSSNGGLSLLRVRLDTGRTHQIRVHLSHIGHPVFGDFLYGEERSDVLPGRFGLHSWRVRFRHPMSGEKMEFYSEWPNGITP